MYITHYDPASQDLTHTFSPPSPLHWLGSDDLGRDTLTRLVWGSRVTLGVALLTVAMALTIGTVVGLVAGYYGGWADEILMRLVDVILALPPIFLFIFMAMLIRPSPLSLAVIVASISWVGSARLVRSEVLAIKSREYIVATRSIGAGNVRIITRHLFPNVLPIVIVAATLGIGQVILIEAALDFLGFGIQPPTPSWGNMVVALQVFFTKAIWVATFPGLAIFITVLAANVLGNTLRDALDPALR